MEARAYTLVVFAASPSAVQQRIQALLTVVSQLAHVPWVEVWIPRQSWHCRLAAVPASTHAIADKLASQVLATGQIILIDNVQQLPHSYRQTQVIETAAITHQVHFYGGFPLGRSPDFIGVLSVMSSQPETLAPEQQQAIATLAGEMGDLLTLPRSPVTAPTPDQSLWHSENASFKAICQSVMRISMALQRCLSFEDLHNHLITGLTKELPLQAFELTVHPHTHSQQRVFLWPTTTVNVPSSDALLGHPPDSHDDGLLSAPPSNHRLEQTTRNPINLESPLDDLNLWRCYPLKVHNRHVGTFKVCLQREALLQYPARGEVLNNLADQIGATVYRLILLHKLQAENLQDPLTHLFNRRHMMGMLSKLMQRVSYGHYQVGLIMLDLDHFKGLNDTYGHDAGDQVLRMLGLFLKGHARPNDVVCRFGGEEFALILPGLTWEILERRANQLCRSIHYLSLKVGEAPVQITLSGGFAIAPLHGKTPSTLIKAADEALYEAKRQGRDRVVGAARPSGLGS